MDSYPHASARFLPSSRLSNLKASEQGMEVAERGKEFEGILDVYVHCARDIHNICIYNKQDVYAKFYLTSEPEEILSTRISKGGGRNPVFEDSLQLKVKGNPEENSLKCEIYMLSCDKQYMEDQLLGQASVPLSRVMGQGKLTKEFELCTTELFHSPAGILELTLCLSGSVLPDVAIIEPPRVAFSGVSSENSIPCKYNEIEFPDLQADCENKRMVSEYLKMTCENMKAENGLRKEPAAVADPKDKELSATSRLGVSASSGDGSEVQEVMSTKSSVHPSNGDAEPENSSSCVIESTAISTSNPRAGNGKGKIVSVGNTEERSSDSTSEEGKCSSEDSKKEQTASSASIMSTTVTEGASPVAFESPLLKVNVQPEQPVSQEQIMDMYMKSVQQFTESLAKMKLPLDRENQDSAVSSNPAPEQSNGKPAKTVGSKVYYGSRAFF